MCEGRRTGAQTSNKMNIQLHGEVFEMAKTSREVLKEFGFEDQVLGEWSDQECDEQLEAIEMYPEG